MNANQSDQPNQNNKSIFVVERGEMRRFVVDCVGAVGVRDPEEKGGQLADLLIAADLRGHYSHGLNRLGIYLDDIQSGTCDGNASPKIVKQKGATAWVDGENALGVVVSNFCTDLAVDLAKEHGIGWVVARHSNHFGIAGHYPLRVAHEHGLIGMAFTNSSPIVFPTRSAQIGLGTSPIACVAPGLRGDDFALDMATSTVALGKVEWALRKGQREIPAQWGADARGRPTRDPEVVVGKGGGLLPLGGTEETGGYKGQGLSMLGELFCGILGGAQFGKNVRFWGDREREADLGQCFVVIDPECFAPGFPERLQRFMDETRALEPIDPLYPVLVPGDPERVNIAKSERLGGLCYPRIDHLEALAKRHGVKPPEYKIVGNEENCTLTIK